MYTSCIDIQHLYKDSTCFCHTVSTSTLTWRQAGSSADVERSHGASSSWWFHVLVGYVACLFKVFDKSVFIMSRTDGFSTRRLKQVFLAQWLQLIGFDIFWKRQVYASEHTPQMGPIDITKKSKRFQDWSELIVSISERSWPVQRRKRLEGAVVTA